MGEGGPVTKRYDVSLTIRVKSVIAGEYLRVPVRAPTGQILISKHHRLAHNAAVSSARASRGNAERRTLCRLTQRHRRTAP